MRTYTLEDLRLKIGKLDECIEIINSWFQKDEQENDTDTLKENMENIKNYFHCVRYLIEDVDKLKEFAQLVKECPDNATHLMPLAADALLTKQRGLK